MAETYHLTSSLDLENTDLSSPVLYLPREGTSQHPHTILLYSCSSCVRYPFPGDFLMFHLDRERIQEYIDSISESSRLTIYTPAGECLIRSESPFKDRGRWITQSQIIESTGWLIEITTPYRIYYSPINRIRKAAVLTLLLMLLMHTLLTRYFTRKQYRPVGKLLKALSIEPSREENEFDRLGSAIHLMNRTLASYREEIREHMLSSFLRGETEIDARQMQELVPGAVKDGQYYPFIYETETSGPGDPNLTRKIRIYKDLKSFSSVRAVTGQAGTVYGLAVSTKENKTTLRSKLIRLKERWDFPVTLILGKTVSDTAELPRMFRECLRYQYYIPEKTENRVIDLEKQQANPAIFSFPDTQENNLLSAIRSGDEKRAFRIVEDLLQENVVDAGLSGPVQDLFLSTLLTTIIRPLMNNFPPDEIESTEMLTVMEDFSRHESLPEKTRILKTALSTACVSFENRKNSHNQELNRKLNAYLEYNALNPAICLTLIADTFNMNQQYISRFYLEQNGLSINRKISDIRMNKACELLKQGKQVKEAARQSGFNSTISFIRVFKKREGITPGRYRQNFS